MDTIRIKGIGTDILLPYPAKEKSPVVIPQPVILKESFTRGLRSLRDIYGYEGIARINAISRQIEAFIHD